VRRLDAALARFAEESLKTNNPGVGGWLAATYAFLGRPEQANHFVDWEHEASELVMGAIALAEGRGRDAVRELRTAVQEFPFWFPLLGRAFELVGEPDSAIAAYERYLREHLLPPMGCCGLNRQLAADAAWRAWLFVHLGELYEERGEREKAVDYYNRFVEQWQDADQELQPQVQDVRERLARLVGERGDNE
jgi:tetratricopeptide (TPR) repeat protein